MATKRKPCVSLEQYVEVMQVRLMGLVRQTRNLPLDPDDLMQELNLALMRCWKRYSRSTTADQLGRCGTTSMLNALRNLHRGARQKMRTAEVISISDPLPTASNEDHEQSILDWHTAKNHKRDLPLDRLLLREAIEEVASLSAQTEDALLGVMDPQPSRKHRTLTARSKSRVRRLLHRACYTG